MEALRRCGNIPNIILEELKGVLERQNGVSLLSGSAEYPGS